MNQRQIQAIWDKALIEGWNTGQHMFSVAVVFVRQTNPSLINAQNRVDDDKFQELYTYMAESRLSRCLDRNADGSLYFSGRGNARSFIAKRSETLSNALWSGKHTSEQILAVINQIRWKKLGPATHKANAADRRVDKMLGPASTGFIGARDFSQHSWDTVK